MMSRDHVLVLVQKLTEQRTTHHFRHFFLQGKCVQNDVECSLLKKNSIFKEKCIEKNKSCVSEKKTI